MDRAREQCGNAVDNILRKVIAIDVLDILNAPSAEDQTVMDAAGVTSLYLRGSGVFLASNNANLVKRNPSDLDLATSGGDYYDKSKAAIAVKEVIEKAARQARLNCHYRDNSQISFRDRLVRRKMGKESFSIELEPNRERLAYVISQSEKYQLTQDEIEVLQNAKISEPVKLKLDVLLYQPRPDMPLVSASGDSEVSINSYQGLMLNNPITELMGKINAINNPKRDNVLDIVDAYNFLILAGKEDGIAEKDKEIIQEHFFDRDSNYRTRLRLQKLEQGKVHRALVTRDYMQILPPEQFNFSQAEQDINFLSDRKAVEPIKVSDLGHIYNTVYVVVSSLIGHKSWRDAVEAAPTVSRTR